MIHDEEVDEPNIVTYPKGSSSQYISLHDCTNNGIFFITKCWI
jgi:hypothetical protein